MFKNESAVQQIANEAVESWEIERIEHEGGTKIYLKGCKYPLKGMPTPESLAAVNVVKKLLIETLKLCKSPFSLGLLFTPKEKLIGAFNNIAYRVISPYILQPDYQQKFIGEISQLVYNILIEYGISEVSSVMFADIISHIFEYDGAYRIRLQDMFSASTKYRLRSVKEIRRIIKLMAKRENDPMTGIVATKTMMFAKLTYFIPPKLRKAIRKAIDKCNYDNLKFDKGDYWWALQRIDYNVNGYSYEKRQAILKEMGYDIVKGKPKSEWTTKNT